MKRSYVRRTGLSVLALMLGVLVIFSNRLVVEVPSLQIKFISVDSQNEQDLVFTYAYEGIDSLRGSKFGRLKESEVSIAKTGQVIEIPSATVTSYWPFSRFTYLSVRANNNNRRVTGCSWVASIWADEYGSLLAGNIQTRETVSRYPYDTHPENEHLLRDITNKVIEIKCF